MNLLHAIIAGNVAVILFNLAGMGCGFPPPPTIAYVIGWPLLIVLIYLGSNA